MERLVATLTPSGLSFSLGGPGLRGLGLHCPRPASVGGARRLLAAFPALGRVRPVSVKPVPELGLEKQQRETLARLAVQVKTGKRSSLVRSCSRRVGFGGGGGGKRGRHHSVRFKCACARGVARALIERPLSTGGRGVHAGRAAGVWGRGRRGRVWPPRGARAAGARGAGGRGARAGRKGLRRRARVRVRPPSPHTQPPPASPVSRGRNRRARSPRPSATLPGAAGFSPARRLGSGRPRGNCCGGRLVSGSPARVAGSARGGGA